MIEHNEKCKCTKHELEFTSEFDKDVVTKIFCPECIVDSPGEAIVFELCEPGKYNGMWAVLYNKAELKSLDPAYRDEDDYFLSLLISGTVGPKIARNYRMGGLCRIFGFKGRSPDVQTREITLTGEGQDISSDR